MFIALAEKVKGVEENLLSYNAFGPVAYLKHQSSKLFAQLAKTSLLNIFAVILSLFRKATLNGCLSRVNLQ